MNDNEQRLMSEAIKTGFRLKRELAEAKEDAAMWEAAFYELLDYHFAHGGDSPNLRFERINDRAAPPSERYEMRNNVDYVTVVRRECWR
jgi:hypothetical protein